MFYFHHTLRTYTLYSPLFALNSSLCVHVLAEKVKIPAFAMHPILATFERKQHLAHHHSSLLTLSNDLITSLQMSMYFKPSLSTGEHVVGEL